MRSWSRHARIALVLALPLGGYALWQSAYCIWGNYQLRTALSAIERRDFDEAWRRLQNYISTWPAEPNVRLLAAQTARRRGDFDEACEQLRAYERLNGQRVVIELEFDLIRFQQGDLRGADLFLNRCWNDPELSATFPILEAIIRGKIKMLQLAADNDVAMTSGLGKQEWDQTVSAVELWLRCRRHSADQIQAWVWRGRLYYIADDQPDRAAAQLRRVLELNPEHDEGRWLLAAVLSDQAPAEAATHLELLKKRQSENAQVRFDLAMVRRKLGQADQAQEILDDLLTADPHNKSYLLERGEIALLQEQPEHAEQFLRRADRLQPDDSRINLALSRALMQLGKETEAKQFLDRSEKLRKPREAKQNLNRAEKL